IAKYMSGLNAGMRGNGGQVAMAVCDFGPMTSRRWQAGDASGRQGGLVLAWDLFRIYAFPSQLNFLPASPFSHLETNPKFECSKASNMLKILLSGQYSS
ncbi:MAG: hypothetical protein KAU38_03785, partial [Desulfobacterales bacterium]|nr:hypothetical protein [Desulfobacterales bacterium]